MKIVIPVAGMGTRLRPHTNTSPKVLIEVAGKPILAHILDGVVDLDPEEIVFIVGPMGEQVERFVSDNYSFRGTSYIFQKEALGLGHAVFLARERVGAQPTLILLGDTIFEADLPGALKKGKSFVGLKQVDDPTRFGVAILDKGKVIHLLEKPAKPPSNLALVGIYYFKFGQTLFDALETNISQGVKTEGEFQLTDAIQTMIDQGEEIEGLDIDGWHDCGKPSTLLATQRHLLKQRAKKSDIPGSMIIPPVHISPSAEIEQSIIGPNVTISEGAVVERSIVSDAIIRSKAMVRSMHLEGAIIGQEAILIGHNPSLQVGDQTYIDFSNGETDR
jgi:glucose-1-phosphate thymidylyltransferase